MWYLKSFVMPLLAGCTQIFQHNFHRYVPGQLPWCGGHQVRLTPVARGPSSILGGNKLFYFQSPRTGHVTSKLKTRTTFLLYTKTGYSR